jgi:hypothetical protein
LCRNSQEKYLCFWDLIVDQFFSYNIEASGRRGQVKDSEYHDKSNETNPKCSCENKTALGAIALAIECD